MSLGGLMKHLALVESQWFDYWFRGVDFAPPFDTLDWESDDDWEFGLRRRRQRRKRSERSSTKQCAAQTRSLTPPLARGGLDVESVRTSPQTGGTWTLRWILAHLIEEYARHNGHADLIRRVAVRERAQTAYDEARCSSATARVTIRSTSSAQDGRSSITPTT